MKVSKQTTNYYKWGANARGWHLVRSKNLSIIEELMPPDSKEKYHFHECSEQFFYILQGVATFLIEEENITIFSNEGIHIPPKTKHKISNNTDRDLRFLLISQPSAKGDRVDLE